MGGDFMISTPRGNRLHISIFGRRNVGKSSIINAITNQSIALVSDVKGTTTDPVYKAMELLPIGPVVFIDTAGIDDEGYIGELRVERTKEVISKTNVALVVLSVENLTDNTNDLSLELSWYKELKSKNIPIIGIINKIDLIDKELVNNLKVELADMFQIDFIEISTKEESAKENLKKAIISNVPEDYENATILGDIIKAGYKILLVAPQDIQAPKGRLILPQVQVIRDILDNKAIPITVTVDNLEEGLRILNNKPDLVITDSQVFPLVNSKLSGEVPLTSFSILMSRYKGELDEFVKGAKALKKLESGDKVLIAEACTHHALKGDIARGKIPKWIKEKYANIEIHNCNGKDFPNNLSEYKLVIHCGSCMLNRAEVLSRINSCREKGVFITNFGIAIAELNGILNRVMEIFIEV